MERAAETKIRGSTLIELQVAAALLLMGVAGVRHSLLATASQIDWLEKQNRVLIIAKGSKALVTWITQESASTVGESLYLTLTKSVSSEAEADVQLKSDL